MNVANERSASCLLQFYGLFYFCHILLIKWMESLTLLLLQPTWITQCPLLLLDTRMPYGSLSVGCEEHLDPAGTGSLYNEGEAEIVLQHVFSLIYSGNDI